MKAAEDSLEDIVVRVVSMEANLRGVACTATDVVKEACRRHHTSPTATVALGRALCGGGLMGALLKGDQRVALRLEGNGPLRKILVEADSHGAVCGTVGNPSADLPPRNGRFDVAGALGRAGLLTVTKDLRLKEPYSGTVQLTSSEIAEDLAYYLTESEQVPSAMGLSVRLGEDLEATAAGGFLVQALPPADAAVVNRVVEHIQALPPLSDMLVEGSPPEELLAAIFEDISFEVLERYPLRFRCKCSRERMAEALALLGKDEVDSLLKDQKGALIRCTFCGDSYRFGLEELEDLIGSLS